MREYINIDVLANWVLMLRADVDGAIWLSDDGDEARFYERCANQAARVVPVFETAFPLLDRVEHQGVRGVVATSRDVRPRRNAPNVFQPSLGDVASLLLIAKSSNDAIRDICGNSWLTACEKEVGPICHRVAWIARVLERLRQECAEEQVRLPDRLEPSEIIDWNTFEPSWDRLNLTLTASGLSQGALDQIRAMRPGKDLRSDLRECDGMDAVRVFAAAIRMYHPRGIVAETEVEAPVLIRMLRVAFELGELEDDDVFWQMRQWERANPRYPLLRQWRALDPLGIVWDQRYWEGDLSAMLNLLQPSESLAVFEMDLDNFGSINKELGHAVGDDAIRLHCKVVKTVLGSVGEVYRRGGDEVVVLAPGLSETSGRDLGERVRAKVGEVFRDWAAKHHLQFAPTASVGLVLSSAGESRSEIIRRADEAQRRAKEQGKNRVVFLS